MNKDIHFMKLALQEAKKASVENEVPVGVILVDLSENIVSKNHNIKEISKNVFGHAELLAIKSISEKIRDWRLNNYIMYVTLEPCIMCMASLVHSRIKKVVFGAYDPKGGAISLGYNYHKDNRLNHNFPVVGGLLQEESSILLKEFFKNKRR